MMEDLVNRHPDDAEAYRQFSIVLGLDGRHEKALQMAKKAVTLMKRRPLPYAPPALFYANLGSAYLNIGQYGEAITAYKKAIHLWPDSLYGRIPLTATYCLAGRMEEAHVEAEEVVRINPKITLEGIARNGYFNFQKADKERFINALRKAGLK